MHIKALRSFLAFTALCGLASLAMPAGAADLLFENVTLIDGTGIAPLPGASVLVKGERIELVSAGPIKHQAGVQVIDGTGKFLMPGLIDSHIHLGANTITEQNWRDQHHVGVVALQGYIYAGIISVYDSGNVPDFIFGLREEERTGKFVSPRLFATGTTINVAGGRGGGPVREVTFNDGTGNGPIRVTDDWKETGPIIERYLKLRKPDLQKLVIDRHGVFEPATPIMSVDVMTKVIRLVNENGVRTTIHAASEEDYNDALAAHIDEFAHVIRYPASEPLVHLMAARKIPMSTTMIVFNYIERIAEDTSFLDEPLFKATIQPEIIARQKGPERQNYIDSGMSAHFKVSHNFGLSNAKRLYDAGAILALGTDRGWAPTTHMEIALLHSAGIPLLALTRIATLNCAIYLGKENELGSIARGKLADLLLLNADPTQDAKNFQAIAAVYKGGQLIDRKALDLPINNQGTAAGTSGKR